MANKGSRSTKIKRSSRSSSRNSRQSAGFSSWLRNIGTRNLAIIAAFVVIFAGTGVYSLHKSLAANCIGTTLAVGSSGYCVQGLQDTLGVLNNYYSGRIVSPAVDGIYGQGTRYAVLVYQTDILGQRNPGGIVISMYSGGKSWGPMCTELAQAYNHYRNAGLTSWRNRAANDYSWLGCSGSFGSI
jgi:hypothetical protein